MNKNSQLDTNKLFLAEVKYFNEERGGIEVSDVLGYAVLCKISKDTYVNIINVEKSYPVFTRVPYSNVTFGGEDFGTKVVHISLDAETGPCYVLEGSTFKDIFGKDKVTMSELEDLILNSKNYFIDRVDIAKKKFGKKPRKMLNIIRKDKASDEKIAKFFEEREVVYKK